MATSTGIRPAEGGTLREVPPTSREPYRIAPRASVLHARIAGEAPRGFRIESMMSLIDDALTCLKPAVPTGTLLIVFGSQARGEACLDSDLDLLVVEPEVPDRFAEMARLVHPAGPAPDSRRCSGDERGGLRAAEIGDQQLGLARGAGRVCL